MPYTIEQYIAYLLAELVLKCSLFSHEWFAPYTFLFCCIHLGIACFFSLCFQHKSLLAGKARGHYCHSVNFYLEIPHSLRSVFTCCTLLWQNSLVYCHNCSLHTEFTPKRFIELSRYTLFTCFKHKLRSHN